MYLEYFGLEQPPFRITPDTRVFYSGGDRGPVLEALAWAVANGEGIVKVVGEVGSGKTMLCRMLATRLPAHVDLVYLVNPGLAAEDVVPAIAFELGLEVDAGSRLAAQHRLHEALVERHAAGRQVVVFIEEAQNMALETLEALRLLSNLETDDSKLLQIVLFGQPELDTKLADPRIRQLRERITHAFDLRPLGSADAASYLNFRMRAVGYRGPDLFTGRIARRLNRHADGLIRRLNLLADKTLLAAYADATQRPRMRHLRRAVRDAGVGAADGRPRTARAVGVSAVVAATLVGALAAWMIWSGTGPGALLAPAGEGFGAARAEERQGG